MAHYLFGIHGDNIVECERMLNLIVQGFQSDNALPFGNIPAPTFSIEHEDNTYEFYFYPAFGRWTHDILNCLQHGGSILREASDVILTRINVQAETRQPVTETPILAIEFCSALPAGNQAWQRSGRAYSTVKANIPYIFVTELGGFELDQNRIQKAARLPNPAIPFSYITYSQYTSNPIAIAYSMNPGADQETKNKYSDVIAGEILPRLIIAIIKEQPIEQYINQLKEKEATFVIISSEHLGARSLNSQQWSEIYNNLPIRNNANDIIDASNFNWNKKISIELTETFRSARARITRIAAPIASSDLPFCIIRAQQLQVLSQILREVYGELPEYLCDILNLNNDIAICWINGFKPRGDDARPDRGLLPFLRMLIGDSIKVITFVYGPATQAMVNQLQNTPNILAQSNGLWEAIYLLSDVIICDSIHGESFVIQQGLMNNIRQNHSRITPIQYSDPFPVPNNIGENDVDTAIHIIFSRLLYGYCFESMCNPPGGDWSGVSLLLNNVEYRWLTLPRVSATGSKRPDHIIQFGENNLITIESKDYFRNLESNIGPRLNQFCIDLFRTPPSCKRVQCGFSNDVTNVVVPQINYISVAAFIKRSPDDLQNVIEHANTDAAFLFTFNAPQTELEIVISPQCNPAFRTLLQMINIPNDLNLVIRYPQRQNLLFI